jgi:hypothetical protein
MFGVEKGFQGCVPVFEAFTIQGQYYRNRRYQLQTSAAVVCPLHMMSCKTDCEQTISFGDNIQEKILM